MIRDSLEILRRSPRLMARILTTGLLLGAAGCAPASTAGGPSPDVAQVPVSIEFRLAQEVPGDGLESAVVQSTGDTVYLNRGAEISNEDIARAGAVAQPPGAYVDLWLTEAGRRRLADVKSRHVGKHMAVLINQVVMGPPAVIVAPEESAGDSVAPMPLTVSLPLEQGAAERLVAAVAQTWPAGKP